MVYLEDGDYCYKAAVPAADKEEAVKFCEGNGRVVSVDDVTEYFDIKIDDIRDALNEASGLSQHEVDYILRTLTETGIAE